MNGITNVSWKLVFFICLLGKVSLHGCQVVNWDQSLSSLREDKVFFFLLTFEPQYITII